MDYQGMIEKLNAIAASNNAGNDMAPFFTAPEPVQEKPKSAIPPSVHVKKGDSMWDKALLVTVRLPAFGNHAEVSSSQIEVDADKNMVSASKSKLDSPELAAIFQFDGATRNWLARKGIKSAHLRVGTYAVPLASVEAVELELLERERKRRTELVPAFIAAYPKQVAEAPAKLKSLYNPRDYPPVEEVKGRFNMDWYWTDFSVMKPPEILQQISAETFSREREKAKGRIMAYESAIAQVLRAEFQTLVKRMRESLEPAGPTGRKKKFYDNLIPQMSEFIKDFKDRNIAGDSDLQAVLNEAATLISGVDAKQIRSDDSFRASLKKQFESVGTKIDSMVIAEPERAFSVEDV